VRRRERLGQHCCALGRRRRRAAAGDQRWARGGGAAEVQELPHKAPRARRVGRDLGFLGQYLPPDVRVRRSDVADRARARGGRDAVDNAAVRVRPEDAVAVVARAAARDEGARSLPQRIFHFEPATALVRPSALGQPHKSGAELAAAIGVDRVEQKPRPELAHSGSADAEVEAVRHRQVVATIDLGRVRSDLDRVCVDVRRQHHRVGGHVVHHRDYGRAVQNQVDDRAGVEQQLGLA